MIEVSTAKNETGGPEINIHIILSFPKHSIMQQSSFFLWKKKMIFTKFEFLDDDQNFRRDNSHVYHKNNWEIHKDNLTYEKDHLQVHDVLY